MMMMMMMMMMIMTMTLLLLMMMATTKLLLNAMQIRTIMNVLLQGHLHADRLKVSSH
jgi:hypothetical protein